MPNSRRRKFSVRNGIIAGREPSKVQNDSINSSQTFDKDVTVLNSHIISLQPSNSLHHVSSGPGPNSEHKTKNNNQIKCSKSKNRLDPNSSRNTNSIDLVFESDTSSIATVKRSSYSTFNKSDTASSSVIELKKDCTENSTDNNEMIQKRVTRETADRTSLKREKYPHQHRIKVRSPKRRIGIGIIENQNKGSDIKKHAFNVGTEAIDWDREVEISESNVARAAEMIDDDEILSDHSSEDMCRICHGGETLSQELGQLISACSCRGTVGRVHVKCLERWLTESGKSRCELCGTRYATRRVHRYGVPRALVMWILSQNAKQLMVDSLGIMLMSPLAVLAAWLSGRTLAGLMTQDAHATPWPLASTFVLACMTLVCYYCWIVSAATRHALGWWIWYRSQYEVRLQLLETED